MGQSFRICNKTKKEGYFCGKMREFCYVGIEETDTLMTLLATTWKRNKIITVGDYSHGEDLKLYQSEKEPSLVGNKVDTNLSKKGYIYNIDTLERIDMAKYLKTAGEDDCGYFFHPLVIMTENDNDGGMGDYRNEYDKMAGVWSGHRLFVSYRNLRRYKDITNSIYHQQVDTNEEAEAYLNEIKIRQKRIKIEKF